MKINDLKYFSYMDSTLLARVIWSCIIEPADYRFAHFVEQMGIQGGLEALGFLVDKKDKIGSYFPGITANTLGALEGWCLRFTKLDLGQIVEEIEKSGANIITPEDPLWPAAFEDLDSTRPVILWALGNIEAIAQLNAKSRVAMVGSRAASNYGTEVGSQLSYELANEGAWIISGGAYGIDSAAHKGAVRATGNTVAVLAGGLGNLYPASNRALFEAICENGLLISESPYQERPAKRRFLTRNRLIAALGHVCVVVEAGMRSGAINTANHAAELGRILATVPGPITTSYAVGSNELLRQGAVCVTCKSDVQELLEPISTTSLLSYETTKPSMFTGLSSQAIKVLDSVPLNHWMSVEKIAVGAGLGVQETRAELGILELDGRVLMRNGRYRLP